VDIRLKPLDPMLFGIKNMRTLVEPETEGDIESVQFPMDPIDDHDGPIAPRQKFFCRMCPGISCATSVIHRRLRSVRR
jgi:hypothetical protein